MHSILRYGLKTFFFRYFPFALISAERPIFTVFPSLSYISSVFWRCSGRIRPWLSARAPPTNFQSSLPVRRGTLPEGDALSCCALRSCRAFCCLIRPAWSASRAYTIELKQGKKTFFPLKTISENRCFSLIWYTLRTLRRSVMRWASFCPCFSFSSACCARPASSFSDGTRALCFSVSF